MQAKQQEDIERHSDPDKLVFYLTENNFMPLNFEIIKKMQIKSAFGKIELAIIGSSHYLKLDNYFTEVMTCAPEQVDEKLLLFSKQDGNFEYTHDFKTFKYQFSVKTNSYSSQKQFNEFERSLLNRKELFSHKFYEDTAITALDHKSTARNFTLATWHSYPQHNKIICSETRLHK